jgi:uncharacterized protein YggE
VPAKIRIVSIAIAACYAFAGLASAQTIQINRDNKTIAISTTDEATAIADIAAVTVGFEIYGPDSQSAYADGGNLSHAIVDALHKAGVDDKSIESGNQDLQRNTRFDEKDTPDQRSKKQFVMRQSWTVSVPPSSAAQVIQITVAAGANQSGAIEWRLSDRKSLQAKAAAAALVKARAVADQMAEGLHVKLGDLIYASNETPNTRIYFPRPLDSLEGRGSGTAYGAGVLAQNAPPLEIRPQIIREEATVYAVFAIE